MATAYRENKHQVYGCFLSDNEAATVKRAIEHAAANTGVSNNRKARMALIELAEHYLKTAKNPIIEPKE